MKSVLPIIRELTTLGDSLMWIVGPGDMVSENSSRGIREPQVKGDEITIQADNWRFHLDAALVGGIQFVETYGDLSSYYVRFSDHQGETLLRAYVPKNGQNEMEGNAAFENVRTLYEQGEGVESVRREVRSQSRQ